QRAFGQIQQKRHRETARAQRAADVAGAHVAAAEATNVLPGAPASPVIARREAADKIAGHHPDELPPREGIARRELEAHGQLGLKLSNRRIILATTLSLPSLRSAGSVPLSF